MDPITSRLPTRRPQRSRAHWLVASVLGAIVAASFGCGYWGSARVPAFAYRGEILIATSPQAQHWLRKRFQLFPHLRRAVEDHGLPLYLLMVDRYVTHMIYPEVDKVVSVNIEANPWVELDPPADRVVVHFEIPPVLLAFLPPDQQHEVRARREERETRWTSGAPLAR